MHSACEEEDNVAHCNILLLHTPLRCKQCNKDPFISKQNIYALEPRRVMISEGKQHELSPVVCDDHVVCVIYPSLAAGGHLGVLVTVINIGCDFRRMCNL